jgi:hypothetical protein
VREVDRAARRTESQVILRVPEQQQVGRLVVVDVGRLDVQAGEVAPPDDRGIGGRADRSGQRTEECVHGAAQRRNRVARDEEIAVAILVVVGARDAVKSPAPEKPWRGLIAAVA